MRRDKLGGKEMGEILWAAGLEIAFKSVVSVTLFSHASWSGLTRNSWLARTHTQNSLGVMKYQIIDSDRESWSLCRHRAQS